MICDIMKKIFLLVVISGILGFFWLFGSISTGGETTIEGVEEATVYLDPDCGCCLNHARYLESSTDIDVEIVTNRNHGIDVPRELQSCHTTVIGDYAVEGHMPIEAFEKLFEEDIDWDGIALPGMPSGSPGMGGSKTEEFEIFKFDSSEGEFETFMVL